MDLHSLQSELTRLTDVKYLKKEIGRIAVEVKNFDVQRHLPPQALERIEILETRFRDALKNLKELQKQVDANLDRVLTVVRTRSFGGKATRTAKRSANGTGKKSAKKKVARKAKRPAKKAARG